MPESPHPFPCPHPSRKDGVEVKADSTFLMKKNKPKVAHVWTGEDTACRMYSTGGLRRRRYLIDESDRGLPICTMCDNVTRRPGSVDFRLDYLNKQEQRL